MNRPVNPPSVAASPFYSHGMEVTPPSRFLLVSGQVGMGPDGAVADGIQAQAGQAVANLHAVLEAAGMTPDDIVKMTIYLTDPDHVGPFMQAAGAALPSVPPATTLLIVQALSSPDLLVEVEAVAAREV